MYPGRVVRLGPPVNWKAIKEASQERERRDKLKSRTSIGISGENSSHSSVASAQSAQRPRSVNSKNEERSSASFEDSYQTYRQSMRSSTSSTTPSIPVSEKLNRLVEEPVLNMSAAKKLAWAGLPSESRSHIWKILLGYAPTNLARREDTLERKRQEYREAVNQHYKQPPASTENGTRSPNYSSYNRAGANQEDLTMRQISVDIPRTCPGQALFHIPEVQLCLQRILYVWATRNPASGYVQGMNDLVTPFFYVFLAEHLTTVSKSSVLQMTDLTAFKNPQDALANAEADSYWCLTALLNDIQDYYTFSQPGIQRRVRFLRELVARVDNSLCTHLEEEGLDFLQFAFRWMNCLLMRELPFPLIVRVWDTYLAETDGFATFHVYVCAALLVSFSDELLEMDFQDLVMFLQNLPTEKWTWKEIDVILSQAYMWRTIFGAAPSHLQ